MLNPHTKTFTGTPFVVPYLVHIAANTCELAERTGHAGGCCLGTAGRENRLLPLLATPKLQSEAVATRRMRAVVLYSYTLCQDGSLDVLLLQQ